MVICVGEGHEKGFAFETLTQHMYDNDIDDNCDSDSDSDSDNNNDKDNRDNNNLNAFLAFCLFL